MLARTTTAAALAVTLALLATTALSLAACSRGEDPVVVAPPGPDTSRPDTPGPAAPGPDLGSLAIELVEVANGYDQPLLALGSGDGSGDLYVAEKGGVLSVIRDGSPEPLLDLSDVVSTESERGLLGVAFPEGFGEHGRFYLSYTDGDGASVISRWSMAEGRVVRASEELIIRVPQPYANHNGGHIVFGPDGYLYASFGDGGSGGDPLGSGQDTTTLLGAMLRIDVGEGPGGDAELGGLPYAIPPDNPFAGGTGDPLDEIWSYGLRNPWRFSFDRATGDLWIGDVGQSAVEEIDFQPASSGGGENWGWNLFEGTSPYPPDRDVTDEPADLSWPIVEYRHPIGRSVTGGHVYRGDDHPSMQGIYLYGDFVSGRIWGLVRSAEGSAENRELLETGLAIVSFGEDDDGELLVVDFGGAIYRVTAR